MRRAGRAGGTCASRLLSGRLAHLRGDRPVRHRRKGLGQSHRLRAPTSTSTGCYRRQATPRGYPPPNARMSAKATSRPSGAAAISLPTSLITSTRTSRGLGLLASPTPCRTSWPAANIREGSGRRAALASKRRFTGCISCSIARCRFAAMRRSARTVRSAPTAPRT